MLLYSSELPVDLGAQIANTQRRTLKLTFCLPRQSQNPTVVVCLQQSNLWKTLFVPPVSMVKCISLCVNS